MQQDYEDIDQELWEMCEIKAGALIENQHVNINPYTLTRVIYNRLSKKNTDHIIDWDSYTNGIL